VPDLPDIDSGLRLILCADPRSVRAALAELARADPLAAATIGDRETVELVLAEVLNNVVEHSYQGAGGRVDLSLHRVSGGLACRVVDSGAPMPDGRLPPGVMPDPPPDQPQALPEGGFGWALIRTLTSDLRYRREGGRNRLDFVIPFAG
jgi:serine/threonine-protein kinase RsbW